MLLLHKTVTKGWFRILKGISVIRMFELTGMPITYYISIFGGRGNIQTRVIGDSFTLGHVIVSNVNLQDSYLKILQEYLLAEYLYETDKDFFDECYGQTVTLHIRKKLIPRLREKDIIKFKRFGVFEPISQDDRLGFLKERLLDDVIITMKNKKRRRL